MSWWRMIMCCCTWFPPKISYTYWDGKEIWVSLLNTQKKKQQEEKKEEDLLCQKEATWLYFGEKDIWVFMFLSLYLAFLSHSPKLEEGKWKCEEWEEGVRVAFKREEKACDYWITCKNLWLLIGQGGLPIKIPWHACRPYGSHRRGL